MAGNEAIRGKKERRRLSLEVRNEFLESLVNRVHNDYNSDHSAATTAITVKILP